MKYKLPSGWALARVGDVFQSHGGGTPSRNTPAFWGGDIAWLSSGDIKFVTVSTASESITKRGLKESAARLCRKGSVLVVVRSGILKHTLPVAVLQREAAINQDIKAFDSGDDGLNSWLALAWRASSRDLLAENREGTTVQSVKLETLQDFEVPIPPLPEQHRIVAKLEALLAKVDACRQRLAKIPVLLKRFRQSVLAAACSGRLTADWREANPAAEPYPVEEAEAQEDLPSRWRVTKLGSLATLVTSGSRGWAKYYSDSGSTFIRAQNIRSDFLNLEDIAFVRPPASTEGSRTKVRQQDILVTITGANVAKSALVQKPIEDAYVSQHVALVRLEDVRLSPYIFRAIIDPARGRKQLLAAAYGQGKPGLNLDNIRDILTALPPLPEQREIVRRVEALFALADRIEARYSKAQQQVDKLTPSLLAKAFRGELVPQDPNDEPAERLLERIRRPAPLKSVRQKRNAPGEER